MKSKDDVAVIIQARTGSTRVPNKMLKPFAKFLKLLKHFTTFCETAQKTLKVFKHLATFCNILHFFFKIL